MLRSMLSVCAFGLALSGVLSVAVWMDARYQLTAPVRAFTAWQQANPDSAGKRILVLNAPNQIGLRSSSPYLPEETEAKTEALQDASLTNGQTLIYAQMIEGDIGAPGQINGMTAYYDNEFKLDHLRMVELTTSHDVVIVAGEQAQALHSRVVGERVASLDQGGENSVPAYLARFESNGTVVLLQTASACFESQALSRTLVAQSTLQVVAGQPATAKLFRHALADAAQHQIGGSDASLFGGLLELHELPLGKSYKDISPIETLSQPQADQVRLGIYDWQTGERWLALKPNGTQWPDNAVVIDVQSMCQ